ncbi:MAG TPA: YlbF family regulator [Longimicrobiales bacterium]
MLDVTLEKARDLGRLIGQTDEYQALQRARQRLGEDRDVVALINRLAELEQGIAQSLHRGEAPEEAVREEYEQVVSRLQASPVYQGLVAAQANFDKVLGRVNEEIAHGMEAGAKSRIILPS